MGRLEAEARAMQSLLNLMESARACRRLFEAANMSLPEPLSRLLGESSDGRGQQRLGVIIPPPEPPDAPSEFRDDWIWIPARDMTPTGLVLGVLRAQGRAILAKDVARVVQAMKPDVAPGSVANIGTRLQTNNTITRNDAGWTLLDRARAPLLHGQYAWGPSAVFTTHELAAHRREAIMHVLRVNSDGLQTTQILKMLERCSWVHAPLSKDLIKTDMEELAKDGNVKRVGNARKWIANE